MRGIYTPCWGGTDDRKKSSARAEAIAALRPLRRGLGADHVTSTGTSPRDEPGALERVIACVRQVLRHGCRPDARQIEPGAPLRQRARAGRGFRAGSGGGRRSPRWACASIRATSTPPTSTRIAFIRRHAAKIYSVHLKDHRGAVSVGIGRGDVDLAALVAVLREVGYDRGLTVELEVEDPKNLPRYTQEAYIYLSGLLGPETE